MARPGTRLSVNLNKVALLRNSRRTGVPDVLRFARLVHDAGAHGITVHPRPDERHIRRDDVLGLSELMRPWRPAFELNVEGYPDERLFDIVRRTRPEQCTLVPDPPGAFTSEEGWKLADRAVAGAVAASVATLKGMGCRVILFVDPDPTVVPHAPATGADGIEIYTGSYAAEARGGKPGPMLAACAATSRAAAGQGLIVNIGHDLNLDNIPPLVAALPAAAEASIGHELTADALLMGFPSAVAAYKKALAGG
ncbi:MAG: pyridoxine 5'-phosphate synthase [Alphaproteobacteria bacterium]